MQETAQATSDTFAVDNKVHISAGLVERIIAVWALSEAALGGVLHALRLPFTGLFVGGMAVVFITLLARFDPRRYGILRGMIIVMIVKLVVSPHAPVNAYMAIAFQGLLGTLLFGFTGRFRTAALLLGIFSLLQSAFQKLILITLVFGMNFWEATDLFIGYVLSQIPILGGLAEHVSFVLLLTTLYISLHLGFGIFVGFWSPVIAEKISRTLKDGKQVSILPGADSGAVRLPAKKRPRVVKRLTYMLVFLISASIFFLSYVIPVFEQSRGMAALIMTFRSLTIILVWYYFIGPFLMRRLRSFLERKESRYRNEVRNILELLPVLRSIVITNWKTSAPLRNPRRFPNFIQTVLVHILTVELKS